MTKQPTPFVDVLDLYSFCQAPNLALFHGPFYTLPAAKDKTKILSSQQILMKLLVKLQAPKIEPSDLAYTINQNGALNYKLLRLIHSSFFDLPRKIGNIKQAIVMRDDEKSSSQL